MAPQASRGVKKNSAPRIVLVHDWLLGMRGGEKCLEALCELFPDAPIFSLFAAPEKLSKTINAHRITASSLNRLPAVRRYYRHLLPLFPLAMRELSALIAAEHRRQPIDFVISISHCAAKNLQLPEGVRHFSYCLTPVRYLWDQYEQYFQDQLLEPLIRMIAAPLRAWDVRGSAGVTEYCAISDFVRSRISRYYSRDASVVFPPVSTDWIRRRSLSDRGDGFLVVNALVPYKNTDLVIEAFNKLGLPLTIVGAGPEERRLRAQARDNIKFLGWVDERELAELYARSKALIFAAEEDFGITPVEMQAAGRPVIALGKGGVLETVIDGVTGVFFAEPTVDSIVDGVSRFLDSEGEFTLDPLRYQSYFSQAERFSRERFFQNISALLIELGYLPAAESFRPRQNLG